MIQIFAPNSFNAAMGPQPIGCGNNRSHPTNVLRSVASMGPQPIGCGNQLATRQRMR